MMESNERLILKQAEKITQLTNECRTLNAKIQHLQTIIDRTNMSAAYWKMLQTAIIEEDGSLYPAWRSFMTAATLLNREEDTPAINAMVKNLYPSEWIEK